jgi:hypothetical protein
MNIVWAIHNSIIHTFPSHILDRVLGAGILWWIFGCSDCHQGLLKHQTGIPAPIISTSSTKLQGVYR